MADEDDVWLVFMTGGMSLSTVALLLLDQAVWYVRYGVFAVALLMLVYALVHGASSSAAA